ncbi:MAG: SGNH/GDSL hydrolase family protein [Candidatus Nealsonbacteria bacterium]|nr:SGNH/GDSL hydrolase family protein [Candidatus Nealsonbacteria bacterium]
MPTISSNKAGFRRCVLLFAVAAALQLVVPAAGADNATPGPNVHLRGSIDNARVQFAEKKTGHVAFIGGSITEMNGYRPMVCEILQRRFPDTNFTFTDAGISSTCSTTGAFRLETDVLAAGPVDLFFIEFAVNDDQDAAHARRECVRAMEGLIRHTRRHNPHADIVITYFCNPGMVETIQAGNTPTSIDGHEAVARHYGVSTINLAGEVARQITAGELTWKQFGGTHPAPPGNALCAGMIDSLMSTAWSGPLAPDAKKVPHPVPKAPLDAGHYGNGRFVDPGDAKIQDPWKIHTPPWKELPGSCRSRFVDARMLCADRAGAELTLAFDGTAVGAYVLAGPDAGTVEASIDGGPVKRIDLYHRFSRGLHYPRTVMFAVDLKPGSHTLRLRISDEKNQSSRGHAVRILQFAVN